MRQSGGKTTVTKTTKAARRDKSAGATRTVVGFGLTTVLVATVGFSAYDSRAAQGEKKSAPPGVKTAAKKSAPAAAANENLVAGLTPVEVDELSACFSKELWPLLSSQCAPCHASKNKSQFLLASNPKTAFLKMLGEGFFDADNHSSVVERVTTTTKDIVMPPPAMGEMKQDQKNVFSRFGEEIIKRRLAHGGKPDEAFPAYLLTPYGGAKRPEGLDNTFLSYRQLKGKVQAIFADDWKRDDRDLFVDNVHLFGGADFVKRFDETSKAAPTFLTGVDLMGRDVASRAYLNRTGPFRGFPYTLPSPVSMKTPSAPISLAIDRLYTRMLFRAPTATERAQAFAFVQGVYGAEKDLSDTAPQDLRFQLTVKDDQGMTTGREVTVKVTADTHALYSEFVDQSLAFKDDANKTAVKTVGDAFTFKPGDAGQKVVVSNAGTYGNVSVSGIVLRGPLPATTEKVTPVSDGSVQPEGAWRIKGDDNFTSYEDNNENKGKSVVTFPVSVAKAGQYEVALQWRRFDKPNIAPTGDGKRVRRFRGPASGAPNVLVEVVSRGKTSRLALPAAPPVPPAGEAYFTIDQTLDTIPFFDLKTSFQFAGKTDGVELRNDQTVKRVVADAVRLAPVGADLGGDNALILKANEAVGRESWIKFTKGTFGAYNTVGPDIFQDTDDKTVKKPGLGLLYSPRSATSLTGFDAAKFYRVGLVFPGQVDNETRAPVVVHAKASSPIVQVVFPYHAHIGAPIVIDASSSFNLQHSKLTYTWTQIGGPRVFIKDPHAARLTLAAPTMARALLSHPDFLFTRPRSLATITDVKQKRRLQLVKIAQDLLARTPTKTEIARVDNGEPLDKLVDGYLKSFAFRDFYFHRTRLYLESHGTVEQDEPARLWTYIADTGHPFKEILTADYTVDTRFAKKTRPAYHGKTGVLTMKGFIEGKPGLPHFNYPAQVTEKFLGYVFEVPDSVLQTRDGITAGATTDPNSLCYTCHKVLTPLAYQRGFWDDEGNYRQHDATGLRIDDSDKAVVASYPYKGDGIEAFALQAQNKERFIRTILQTHFVWYFGRELRYEGDERTLYKRLWDVTEKNNFAVKPLIKVIVLSPEYLNGPLATPAPSEKERARKRNLRMAKLATFHKAVAGRDLPGNGGATTASAIARELREAEGE